MMTADDVKSRNPIEQVIGRVVALKKKSGGLMGLCPFHEEKTPSFVVYANTQRYKCYGCGASGDVIDFVSVTSRVPFLEAKKILEGGSRYDVKVIPVKVTPPEVVSDRLIKAYEESLLLPDLEYEDRVRKLGVSAESWRLLGATWSARRSAWIIPFRDSRCKIVGFQLRSLRGFKWTVDGTHLGLFIPRMKVQKLVYIAEGASDCAALLTLGVYAIARPAAFACHDMLSEFIDREKIERAIIIPDYDPKIDAKKTTVKSPGVDSAIKLKMKLKCDTSIILPPGGMKDIREALKVGLTKAAFAEYIRTV